MPFPSTFPLLRAARLVALLLPLAGGLRAAEAPKIDVLVLHSYHQGLSWSDGISRGIALSLAPLAGRLEMDFAYLDVKRHPELAKAGGIPMHLREKYARRKPGLVIACDNAAFETAKVHRDAFGEAPLLFCGINGFRPEMTSGVPRVAGVEEHTDPLLTFELIRKARPDLHRLVLVGDSTDTGRLELSNALRQIESLRSGVELLVWSELPVEELEARLRTLRPDDAVLLVLFNSDAKGRYFSYEEAGALVSSASAAPVFGLWDFYLGYGVVGGYMARSEDQGRAVGEMALRFLSGDPVSADTVVRSSPNRPVFDVRALERWQIAKGGLPSGSVWVGDESGWFKEHLGMISGFGAVIAGEAILILVLASFLGRRSRSALRELRRTSEARFQLFESVPDPIWVLDEPGRITLSNRAASTVSGFPREEMVGLSWLEFFKSHSGGEGRAARGLERLPDFGRTHLLPLRGRQGRTLWLEVRLEKIEWEGAPSVLVTARDQSRLRASEEKFSKAFFENPIPMTMTRLVDGKIYEVNHAFLRVFGWQRSEVVGRTTVDLGLFLGGREGDVERFLVNGREGTLEVTLARKGGELLPALLSSEPLEVDGEAATLSSFLDLRPIRLAERLAVESEERYRLIVQTLPEMVLIHRDNRILFVNRAVEAITGYAEKDLVGASLVEFLTPESRLRIEAIQVARRDGAPEADYVASFLTRTGGVLTANVRAVAIRFHGEDALLAILTPVGGHGGVRG